MMQAMIFAAGMGTRLKPITDTMPKAMVSVAGQPLIRRVIEKLWASGVDRIVVNVHHFASQITDYLKANNNFGLDIRVSDETDKLLNTGGGIKKASPLFDANSPVLIHNVDILSNVNLAELYRTAVTEENGVNPVDAVVLVSSRVTKRYLLFDDEMRLVGWTNIATGEVKTPYPHLCIDRCKRYAFAGIHVISPRVFPLMDTYPEQFSIIDFYLQICATRRIKGIVKPDLKLMDVGKMETLQQAEAFLHNLE